MTNILFYATLALNFSGFIFSAVFLWINISGRYTDLTDRNANTLKIAKTSMTSSILFAFLSCLLADSNKIGEAIAQSAKLYSWIAITWLVVGMICGFVLLLTVISKKLYKPEILNATKKLFKTALLGSIIGLVLTWLFS